MERESGKLREREEGENCYVVDPVVGDHTRE